MSLGGDMQGRGNRGRRSVGLVVLALAAATGCIEDLGTPPGLEQGEGVDVNAAGTVLVAGVGWFEEHGYVRSAAGDWAEVPPLEDGGGFVPAAIDNAGTVLGTSTSPSTGGSRPVLWDAAGGSRPVPAPFGDHESDRITAVDLNDAGVLVGTSPGIGGVPLSGWVWDPATARLTWLRVPVSFAGGRPVEVNEAGQVAGTIVSAGAVYAVRWDPPAYDPVVLLDPAGRFVRSQLNAIDEDGTVVGLLADGQGTVGARWDPTGDGRATLLPGIVPTGIDGGDIVGRALLADGTSGNAVWWGAGEDGPEPLGTLNGGRSAALAITGDHVVGWATAGPFEHVARFAPAP